MSDGNEVQRNNAVTGNVHRPTVRAVGVTMLTEVCDLWAGRRHGPADSGMVAREGKAEERRERERGTGRRGRG